MNIRKSLAAFTMLASVTALGASNASADEYRHIDELALDIQAKAALLTNETVHYRHTSQYRHLVADAVALRRLAGHVHEIAHRRGSLAHLQADLRDLDATFHHVEGLVTAIERHAYRGRGGHVHGDTRHVRELLIAMEDCIHHMQDDVAALRRLERRRRATCPQTNPYPYGQRYETIDHFYRGNGRSQNGRSQNGRSQRGHGYQGHGFQGHSSRGHSFSGRHGSYNLSQGGFSVRSGNVQFRIGF